MSLVAALWHDERGAVLVEYALILSLLSLAAMAGFSAISAAVDASLANLAGSLSAWQTAP
ncbi:MAG: hypothetical protein JOZ24_11065 [Candidatus Eremiobacteraeota bacterium]|nr:hypothetical protein [Candidatus Eremiobacteraeota bacterium]